MNGFLKGQVKFVILKIVKEETLTETYYIFLCKTKKIMH